MAPTLYMVHASPPVRSVLLCAKAIDLKLTEKQIDVIGGELHKPEYIKVNPQHTVPMLDDDGFVVIDSHAIMGYLVSKYGKDDSLYPKEPKQRAIVDHRLHFDTGILFSRGLLISRGIILDGEKSINQKYLTKLEEAFDMAEKLLEQNSFIAGDNLTIADFSFVTSLTSWSVFVPITEEKFPKISAWIKKMQKLPYYKEANQTGLDEYFYLIKSLLA